MKWEWVRNRWFRGIHLAMILIVVFEVWAGITCPLTTWERQLRDNAGQKSYEGDFIAGWVHEVLFIDPPSDHWVFPFCYTLFGGLVLASLFLVKPRWRTLSRDPSGEHRAPRSVGSRSFNRDPIGERGVA